MFHLAVLNLTNSDIRVSPDLTAATNMQVTSQHSQPCREERSTEFTTTNTTEKSISERRSQGLCKLRYIDTILFEHSDLI